MLKRRVVRMAHDYDIPVAQRARGTQGLEGALGVRAVARQGGGDLWALGRAHIEGGEWTYLFVDNYIYLDAGFRASLEHAVEPPFLVEVRRATEKLRSVSLGASGEKAGVGRLASSGESHQSAM